MKNSTLLIFLFIAFVVGFILSYFVFLPKEETADVKILRSENDSLVKEIIVLKEQSKASATYIDSIEQIIFILQSDTAQNHQHSENISHIKFLNSTQQVLLFSKNFDSSN